MDFIIFAIFIIASAFAVYLLSKIAYEAQYNKLLDDYNKLVDEYNELLKKLEDNEEK